MCYQIAVGKNATVDGSVLVARSCDSNSAVAIRIISVPSMKHDKTETIKFPSGVEIPQARETYGYVTTAKFTQGLSIELVMGGVNEYQVSAGSSSGDHCLKEEVKKVSPRHPTAIGDYRTTIALQRAKTAREAIEIMADLTEKYGARRDNYVLADPNEAWLWEEFQDHRWIAVRVPDDSFIVEANNRRIANIDLDDTENYMGSKDIIDFAVEHGFYDPEGGEPFSCARVYSNRGEVRHGVPALKYNTRRIWRGISLLAPSTKLDPEADYYPLFVKPDRKLTPKDLLNVMRDHYQGTKYDLYAENWEKYKYSDKFIDGNRKYQLSPSWNRERPIGISRSVTNWVAQLRGWLPNPIGGVLWGGLAAAWANAHVPWYVGITKTPEPYNKGTNLQGIGDEYDENSAYWVYETVTNLVNLFYRMTIDEVLPVWEAWEDRLYAMQPSVEGTALKLYEKDRDLAIEYLTSYSNAKGLEALDMGKEMTKKLLTIITVHDGGRPAKHEAYVT